MRTKHLQAKIDVTDEAKREVVAIVSTLDVDRDSEVIMPSGMDLTNYRKNPIVLFNHDTNIPIGKSLWIKSDGKRLLAKYRLGSTQFAQDIFCLLKDGILNSHSVGFSVTEDGAPTEVELSAHPEWKTANNIIRKGELMEYSVVSVPANPEAVTLAVKSVSPETLKMLGEAWQPRPDCWEWVEEKEVEVEKEPIPMPAYSRSWTQIEKKIKSLADSRMSTQDIMNILHGKA